MLFPGVGFPGVLKKKEPSRDFKNLAGPAASHSKQIGSQGLWFTDWVMESTEFQVGAFKFKFWLLCLPSERPGATYLQISKSISSSTKGAPLLMDMQAFVALAVVEEKPCCDSSQHLSGSILVEDWLVEFSGIISVCFGIFKGLGGPRMFLGLRLAGTLLGFIPQLQQVTPSYPRWHHLNLSTGRSQSKHCCGLNELMYVPSLTAPYRLAVNITIKLGHILICGTPFLKIKLFTLQIF